MIKKLISMYVHTSSLVFSTLNILMPKMSSMLYVAVKFDYSMKYIKRMFRSVVLSFTFTSQIIEVWWRYIQIILEPLTTLLTSQDNKFLNVDRILSSLCEKYYCHVLRKEGELRLPTFSREKSDPYHLKSIQLFSRSSRFK